jgi:predicted ABC-class ATPase
MRVGTDLQAILRRIDGRGYKAYKEIRGVYDCGQYVLSVEHVQGDPYASPSRVHVRVPQALARFPDETYSSKSREVALRDYLTRKFVNAARKFSKGNRGIGKSGEIVIDEPTQEILERTSMFITQESVDARFVMGLPAYGRKIAGDHALEMFFEELPMIVRASLFMENMDMRDIVEHIETAEDADFLRMQLHVMNLTAFVADGAILPRKSGIDSRPLTEGMVVPFEAPESLRVTVDLPNRGSVTGMGIPKGVTLIVGGGYHGKSTLLKALELGVYNHIPGDGRECVVTNPWTVKIRAEDGRRIEKVNISPFIANLPFGKDTGAFSTGNASGSTSQAANIIEALEIGAQVILIDEDTSATNFMIRDHRMQELVAKDKEPITPFIDKVRQLYEDHDVSTILAIGGSGDYFDVADKVICMIDYKPYDLTAEAHRIARHYQSERNQEGGRYFGKLDNRVPMSRSFDPSKGKREVKISSKGLQSIAFGRHTIDLGAVEQLVDISQTRAIGDAIYYGIRYMDGRRTLNEIVERVLSDINNEGLDILSPWPVGDYAMFRGMELTAAINRLRTLRMKVKSK